MPDEGRPGRRLGRARGPAPAWLRLAVICVLLVVVPVAVYLFAYQRHRVEQATIRNFRALDAASGRVVEVMTRLAGVVDGSSFGISPTMLDEVTERITGRRTGCVSDEGVGSASWRGRSDHIKSPEEFVAVRRPTAAQRLEFRYRRAVEILVHGNDRNAGATERLWNQLHCLIDTHRRYSKPVETIQVEVSPSPRVSLHSPSPPPIEHCGELRRPDCRRRFQTLLESKDCPDSTPSPRLNAGASGSMAATLVDCRPLHQRNRDIHRALESFHGSGAVLKAVDLFGIQSTAQLDQLMQQATGYLSRFFDSHLIADGGGRILFEAQAATSSRTEIEENRVATPAFSSHVDISELLRVDSSASPGARSGAGDESVGRVTLASARSFRGRSFVAMVRVQNIELRVFVHPFIMDGIDVSSPSEPTPGQGRPVSNSSARPTFYLVGTVDESEFQSAAIKLRLSLVIYATLLLLALLTLSPLLWFWTAGDRWFIGPLGLVGVCATPVFGVVLLVVLACAMVTNRVDGQVLDSAIEQVGDRMVKLFDQELRDEIRELQGRVPRLLARADSDARQRRRSEGQIHIWQTMLAGPERLSQLERTLYCDDEDRNLPYRPEFRDFNATLLDEYGRQLVCLSSGNLTRTPKLPLDFREYFKRPQAGALWYPPPADGQQPVECRIRAPHDKTSRIPCVVDRLHEPSKQPVSLADASNLTAGIAEVPYFLERIDSVVRADVMTILAVNTGRSDKPVATTRASLNALDRTVPPAHVDFAVIDRETGRTLFHSDDGLAMTTNFVEDVGGAPELRSLLRARARDTIDLVYAGIPIRAHVRPLREGMPWVLIVYRGHEVADRLTAVTTALSIFYTLACLILTVMLAVLVPLMIHWCRPDMLEGVAGSLGRVMGMSSRFRVAGASVAAALALLLFSPWLTLAPSLAANPWLPWNEWNAAGVWSPWRAFPFFAVYSTIAAVGFVVYCVLGMSDSTAGNRYGSGAMRRILVLATVIVCLAVVPVGLWFGHQRAALGVGVNQYLVDRTLESVARAREDYRLDRLDEFGAGEAGVGDRTLHWSREEQEPDESWLDTALRQVVGFSQLSNELMVYRALPRATTDEVASLYEAFSRTFGYNVPWPFPERQLGPLSATSLVWLLLIAILVVTVAYFVCAVCTIVRGRRGGVVELPAAKAVLCGLAKGDSAPGEPPRLFLLNRCPSDFDTLVEEFQARSPGALRRFSFARDVGAPPRVSGSSVPESSQSKPVYFFDDLEAVLEDSADGRVLFRELERLFKTTSSPILICSTVVPDYRYSDRFGPTDQWFHNHHGDGEERRSRWSHIARGFRSYVLHDGENGNGKGKGSNSPGDCGRTISTVAPGGPNTPNLLPADRRALDRVTEAMQAEVCTNPELHQVAVGVVAEVAAGLESGTMQAEEACALAVTKFRKCAASCFNDSWERSTHDERLQLYALARGGVVNSRRIATLSSLLNRGIVEVNDRTGVVRLRSSAFGEFIVEEIDHGKLNAWRKEGGGGGWRLIWPPLAIAAGLGLAFLAMANPEMRATLLAGLLGLLPAALPLFRGAQGSGSPGSTAAA